MSYADSADGAIDKDDAECKEEKQIVLTVGKYYWVIIKSTGDLTIGQYCRGDFDTTNYPWEVIGSDGIFKQREISVVYGPIEEPIA